MKIPCFIPGTKGDVQSMVALAKLEQEFSNLVLN
jgi:hypothetical protein